METIFSRLLQMSLAFILSSSYFFLNAQHTFSIVAVDPVTGEVGSAGATCLDDLTFPGSGGAVIISDLVPGRGAINTQAYYVANNQLNARLRMIEGDSPEEIIDWMIANDISNDPELRQYGIADFDEAGNPRSAGYTGISTDDYKGHLTGTNYSIQGNILLGAFILDSMESRFLNAEGTLANRLMEALQGANVVGADTRCLDDGVSSLSSYLRVARPDDELGSSYINLVIPYTPVGVEPIDTLQGLYDWWTATTAIGEIERIGEYINVYPNPAGDLIRFKKMNQNESGTSLIEIYSPGGNLLSQSEFNNDTMELNLSSYSSGLYFYVLKIDDRYIGSGTFLHH